MAAFSGVVRPEAKSALRSLNTRPLISFPELFTTERSAFAQLGDARL